MPELAAGTKTSATWSTGLVSSAISTNLAPGSVYNTISPTSTLQTNPATYIQQSDIRSIAQGFSLMNSEASPSPHLQVSVPSAANTSAHMLQDSSPREASSSRSHSPTLAGSLSASPESIVQSTGVASAIPHVASILSTPRSTIPNPSLRSAPYVPSPLRLCQYQAPSSLPATQCANIPEQMEHSQDDNFHVSPLLDSGTHDSGGDESSDGFDDDQDQGLDDLDFSDDEVEDNLPTSQSFIGLSSGIVSVPQMNQELGTDENIIQVCFLPVLNAVILNTIGEDDWICC
jgi:hypothetical protein